MRLAQLELGIDPFGEQVRRVVPLPIRSDIAGTEVPTPAFDAAEGPALLTHGNLLIGRKPEIQYIALTRGFACPKLAPIGA